MLQLNFQNIVVYFRFQNMYSTHRTLYRQFSSLAPRTEASWNRLINGLLHQGELREALIMYHKMQDGYLEPNPHTFVSLLKACAKLKDVRTGAEMHADVSRNGLLDSDVYIGSSLVDMYAKCGLLTKAREVLDTLAIRNVVSWNAMVSGYAKHEQGENALNCLDFMLLEGTPPNGVTFTSCLKACGSIGAIGKGFELHEEIVRQGFLKTDFVLGGALVDMYSKFGMLSEAQDVFDEIPERSLIAWNGLIAGYAKCNHAEEALRCFEDMQFEDITPDAITFASTLKACGTLKAVEKGSEIYVEVARRGLLKRDPVLGSALVDMYAKCGMLDKAIEIFGILVVRDVVAWTAMLASFVEQERYEEALVWFEQMKLDGVAPDAVAFACSLKACGSIGARSKGEQIKDELEETGFLGKHLIVGNALLDMYSKFGLHDKVKAVFEKLPERDIISWNTLISGYAKLNCGEKVLDCFHQMLRVGISPDAITYISCLKACGSIGAKDVGISVHRDVERNGLLLRDVTVGNALIDMYAKCGSPGKAEEVFNSLPNKDLVSWNSLISGYAQLGESNSIFRIFDQMKQQAINPDSATFSSVLSACNHAGLVEKALTYFNSMVSDYKIVPTPEHHTSLVDLLGRAGQLEKAIGITAKLPFHPDSAMWCTVLGACRKWGNIDLAKRAFEHAIRTDDKDSAAYVCMSNIFADAHMHEDAKRVEEMRMRKQAWKGTGSCWWDEREDTATVERTRIKKEDWKMLLLD